MSIHLSAADWLDLFVRYLSLSLLAVGGAIGTAPAMHRYLVIDRQWLTEPQFGSSIALAQAAPGPNVLFVALMGWNVGLNAGGGLGGGPTAWALALLGVAATMTGILLPSSILTYSATQWAHRNRELRAVRAFKVGMAPMVIALMLATGWLLIANHDQPQRDWPLWLLATVATLLVCRGRVVVMGMGKSGHVGRKIAATLASTGTPSFFVHPAEASHGDLGMVQPGDVVLALSNSGESDELAAILPAIRRLGARLVAMTGHP